MRGDNGCFRCKAILDSRSLRRALVREARRHCHRAVEYQRGPHRRPSAIRSWTRRPSNRLRLASSRILTIASLRFSIEWTGRAGTNRATGVPWCVIVEMINSLKWLQLNCADSADTICPSGKGSANWLIRKRLRRPNPRPCSPDNCALGADPNLAFG